MKLLKLVCKKLHAHASFLFNFPMFIIALQWKLGYEGISYHTKVLVPFFLNILYIQCSVIILYNILCEHIMMMPYKLTASAIKTVATSTNSVHCYSVSSLSTKIN